MRHQTRFDGVWLLDIPHLRKQGTATQLIVDGKPFLALAENWATTPPPASST